MRLIKHNFPFIPPHCGIHIAQYRGTFPDRPAQTLFDLLNRRDFVLSLHLSEQAKRRCPTTWGGICTTATLPFWFVQKEGGARNRLLFHKKRGRSPSCDNVILASPIPFLVLPPRQRILVRMERFYTVFRNYQRERYSSFVGQLQNSPRIGERRDSWGVVSYPNVEQGAIRNRRARAHAPQRHRGRTRPYHPPWRSGVRHRHRP